MSFIHKIRTHTVACELKEPALTAYYTCVRPKNNPLHIWECMRGWYDSDAGRLDGEKINTTEIIEERVQFCKFRNHYNGIYNALGRNLFIIYKYNSEF